MSQIPRFVTLNGKGAIPQKCRSTFERAFSAANRRKTALMRSTRLKRFQSRARFVTLSTPSRRGLQRAYALFPAGEMRAGDRRLGNVQGWIGCLRNVVGAPDIANRVALRLTVDVQRVHIANRLLAGAAKARRNDRSRGPEEQAPDAYARPAFCKARREISG